MTSLLDLPEEIQLLILSHLDATSLCSTCLTCHHLHNLAAEDVELGNFAEAEERARTALAGRERVLGETNYMTTTSVAVLGQALAGLGRHAEASGYLKRALDAFAALQGPSSTEALETAIDYANTLASLGRPEESAAMLRSQLRDAEHDLGEKTRSPGQLELLEKARLLLQTF